LRRSAFVSLWLQLSQTPKDKHREGEQSGDNTEGERAREAVVVNLEHEADGA
jgi:hypothetical protein